MAGARLQIIGLAFVTASSFHPERACNRASLPRSSIT
jgi:hypothetical protein